MARTVDAGIEYVPLDTDIFQDRKIRRLQRKCGPYAPMVYVALLCSVYKEGYYVKWDEDFAFDLADSIHIDEDTVNGVIIGCLEIGLLDAGMFETHRVITSYGIQKQYQAICEKSKRKSRVGRYSLLDQPDDDEVSSEEKPINPEEKRDEVEEKPINSGLMRQSKVKESKGKKSYYSSSPENGDEEEEEQEKIVSYFLFEKNYSSPNEEYRKMVVWNNGPQARRKWAELSPIEKDSVMRQWRQNGDQSGARRFPDDLLTMWRGVYDTLVRLHAPADVRMAALSDRLGIEHGGDTLVIRCRRELYLYIEVPDTPGDRSRISEFKPVIWPYMRERKLKRLKYLGEDGEVL